MLASMSAERTIPKHPGLVDALVDRVGVGVASEVPGTRAAIRVL
jgi:hypothetical protein